MRRLPAATIALACALTLAGCSDDGREPADSQSTWTPTATPESPSTSAVSDPAVAPENETARQFIRRFVQLGNHMQNTGETAAYLAASGPDCEPCEGLANQIREIYSAGGYVKTAGDRVREILDEGNNQWSVDLVTAPTEYRETANSKVRRLPGGQWTKRFFLARDGDRWLVGYSEEIKR